jgi:hypothetical protein
VSTRDRARADERAAGILEAAKRQARPGHPARSPATHARPVGYMDFRHFGFLANFQDIGDNPFFASERHQEEDRKLVLYFLIIWRFSPLVLLSCMHCFAYSCTGACIQHPSFCGKAVKYQALLFIPVNT